VSGSLAGSKNELTRGRSIPVSRASAGDARREYLMPGRPMMQPHKFATVVQCVCRCGRMPVLRPMTAPSATMAGMATKSGGHCICSAISATQGAIVSGSKAMSNEATWASPFGSGFGSGHSGVPSSERCLPEPLTELTEGERGVCVALRLACRICSAPLSPLLGSRRHG
jgi:hypothetical protein